MNDAALVLCGGFSKRMGEDKAHLPFGAATLIEHIVATVSGCVDEVWLVAREGQAIPANERLGLPVARDPASGEGPLAGLAAGLAAVRASQAFVVSCDAPLVVPALIEGLLAIARRGAGAIPHVGGHYMTTCAVYGKTLLPEIERLLASQERRPRVLAEQPGVAVVDEETVRRYDPDLRSFIDCNTRERYLEALELAGLSGSGT
ncbi:MAG: molybdenum cofactor guanylyltransferase [Myxococcota bacterium]|jgi:molybdopterin-guanine dinucleotide biosynthesis protein A|nr:molybdenum cofactor guanylyltransferase [Myxococcota bacterium]